MKRTIRSEEQIIGILQKHEAGAKCADLCRKHGMSEGTFYAWKEKYSGMTVSEAMYRPSGNLLMLKGRRSPKPLGPLTFRLPRSKAGVMTPSGAESAAPIRGRRCRGRNRSDSDCQA
jgi:hypothetical protein